MSGFSKLLSRIRQTARNPLVPAGFFLVAAGAGALLFLGSWLSTRVDEQIERELIRHLQIARSMLAQNSLDDAQHHLRKWVKQTPFRLTLMAADGKVIADSEVLQVDLATLENHAARPEMNTAQLEGMGVSRRYSHTLHQDLLYVALPILRKGNQKEGWTPTPVLRISLPLAQLDSEKNNIWAMLLLTGLMGMVLALLILLMATNAMKKTLSRLVRTARALALEKSEQVTPVNDPDAIDLLSFARPVAQLGKELRRTVQALAAERDRTVAVLDGMQEGVFSLDQKLRIRMANHPALALLRVESLPEKAALLDLLDVQELKDAFARFEADHEADREDALDSFEFSPPFAQERIFVGRLAPLSKYRGFVLVLADVTPLRGLETLRREFVANVSHELRTPVAVILSAVEALLDGAMDDDIRGPRFLDAVYRNAKRLSHLVSDVLDLARLEAGARSLQPRECSLFDAVEEALLSLESGAQEAEIHLENTIGHDVVVCADEIGLEQVLVNFLANAVKYAPARTQVKIEAAIFADQVEIQIIDAGPGIATEHQSRLFERFFRVDHGRSKEAGGTGLGLSIVKHLVSAMGGDVGYRALSPGSCFWFSLPKVVVPENQSQA
ncbi:MAG: hypothetical protein GY822_25555 [Deltaproteobacteria bacterium]|nr:hypothetical protein [Deltaproteobacteria bacterium]